MIGHTSSWANVIFFFLKLAMFSVTLLSQDRLSGQQIACQLLIAGLCSFNWRSSASCTLSQCDGHS
jgi:hypothetical protein